MIVSIVEIIVCVILIIGHNILQCLPNEVPILAIIAILSFIVRDKIRLKNLRNPMKWSSTIGIASLIALLRIIVGDFIVMPCATYFWQGDKMPEGASELSGNLLQSILALLFVWVFAAVGEEIIYRRYLISRIEQVLGKYKVKHFVAVTSTGLLFGIAHYYKGVAGIIDSTYAGLLLGYAYVRYRNLWVCILAHGFIDTIAIAWIYLGL